MKHIDRYMKQHSVWECLTGPEVDEDTEAGIDCVPIKVQTVTMINTVNHWSTYWTSLNSQRKESAWT